ncbi:MAG TPA: hypothetical protein VGM81_25830 [Burkholderiaceae bacterium]|jgi:hypothetical protein
MIQSFGTIWFVNERNAPPVADRPVVRLRSWRIIETPPGNRHVVAVLDSGSLRVTSPIQSFDLVTCTVTTTSGRRYELSAPPEAASLPRQLMMASTLRPGLIGAVDVSDAVWESLTSSSIQDASAP